MMKRAISLFTTLCAAAAMLVLSLILIPLSLLAGLFGWKARMAVSHFFRSFLARVAFWGTLSRLRVRGVENIPKRESFVVFANHSSFFDISVLSGFPFRKASFLGRKELITWGPIGLWILVCGGELVERRGTRKELKRVLRVVSRIKNGLSFIIFPEGTRSVTGELGPFRRGSLKIPMKAGAKLLPVRLEGTRDLLPRGVAFPTPADVTVYIGKPISPREIREDAEEVIERLREFLSAKEH